MILIAALTGRRVIGRRGAMPWHISEELKHFRKLTTGHTLIVGRKTFESLGSRTLPRRHTVVVSRTLPDRPDVDVCRTLDEALRQAKTYHTEVFVAGGAEIYRQALPLADALYLSWVKEDHEGDTHFPEIDDKLWEVDREEDFPRFTFVVYRRRPTP
ncbi:MAG: dihydrofolate reductase [Candidatus Latescibacteria bacterium]|jgi:dihydrofolate reductase|nr:dihydrofolate reductase [Candidatus Latescibacterota bacterium]